MILVTSNEMTISPWKRLYGLVATHMPRRCERMIDEPSSELHHINKGSLLGYLADCAACSGPARVVPLIAGARPIIGFFRPESR
jgi:hypothetical protein